jgi:hypothetical protein
MQLGCNTNWGENLEASLYKTEESMKAETFVSWNQQVLNIVHKYLSDMCVCTYVCMYVCKI